MIRLRFVTGNSAISALIRAQERTTMPFIPSHVEAYIPPGILSAPAGQAAEGYLGAHYDGGVMLRPIGYDAATMTNELLLDLPADDAQTAAFHAYLSSKIGAPYDWKSILDFIDPLHDIHDRQHVICSALQTLALRKCSWFPGPLPVPAHQISPRDLLLTIGGRVAIPGV
jgi:hypothetical protein